MHSLLLIFLIIALAYFGILHFVFWGLKKLPVKEQTDFPQISVVIAARNEAERIGPALEALEKLDYPTDKYEIIFMDDASTDNTAERIEMYCRKHGNWKLLHSQRNGDFASGKKQALKEGIAAAKGDIIFTTDADCTVTPKWLRYMSAYFEPKVSMVLGYSPIKRMKGWMNTLQQFDDLFSAIVSAAPTMWGLPISSVGRNLAYLKQTYQSVGGFDALKRYRSGDDLYLMERFNRLRNTKITFCAHPQTFVETQPPLTFRQFWHQQIRKNSKTLHRGFKASLFSLLIFVVYAFLLVFPLFMPEFFYFWLSVIGLKLIAEFIVLKYASKIFHKNWIRVYLPFFQLVYPLIITFFTILGLLQRYEWKK